MNNANIREQSERDCLNAIALGKMLDMAFNVARKKDNFPDEENATGLVEPEENQGQFPVSSGHCEEK